jgi:ketosteroid isomerase-like protein
VTGEVLDANGAYYELLEARDLAQLASLHAPRAGQMCVHPGRAPIVGIDAVLTSWEAIFSRIAYMQFIVTNAAVLSSSGALAVVTCRESLMGRRNNDDPIRPGSVAATNVFVRDGNRWLILAHHGSVIQPSGPQA